MNQPQFSVRPKFIYWWSGRVRLQWHCPEAHQIQLYRTKCTSAIPDTDNIDASDCELLFEDDEHVGRGFTDDVPGTGYYAYTLVVHGENAAVQASTAVLKVSEVRLVVLMLLVAAFCGALLNAFLNFVIEPDLTQLTGMARALTALSWAGGAMGAVATFPLIAFILGQVPDSLELPLGKILISDRVYYATVSALALIAAAATVFAITSNDAVIVNDTEETVAAFANDELVYVVPPGMHRIRPSGDAYDALLTAERGASRLRVAREFSPDKIRLDVIETKSGDATRAVRMSCPDVVQIELPSKTSVRATLQLDDKKYEPVAADRSMGNEARFVIRNQSCSQSALGRANLVVLEMQAELPEQSIDGKLAYNVTLKDKGLWTDAMPSNLAELQAHLVAFDVPWSEKASIAGKASERAWRGNCAEQKCYLFGLTSDHTAVGGFTIKESGDETDSKWDLKFTASLEDLRKLPVLAGDDSARFRAISLSAPTGFDYGSLHGLRAIVSSGPDEIASQFRRRSPFSKAGEFAYIFDPGGVTVEVEGYLEFRGSESEPVRIHMDTRPTLGELAFSVDSENLQLVIVDAGFGLPTRLLIRHPTNGVSLEMESTGHGFETEVPSLVAAHLQGAELKCVYSNGPSRCGHLDDRGNGEGSLVGSCDRRCADVPNLAR